MAVLGLLLGGQAAGQTWYGNVSTDWNNPTNWTPAWQVQQGVLQSVPGSGVNISISAGCTYYPVVTSSMTIGTLTMYQGNGSFTVAGGTLTCSTVTVGTGSGYSFVVNSGATVDCTSSLTVDGILTVNGSLTCGAIATASPTFTIGSGGIVTSSGTLTMGGNLAVNGALSCGVINLNNTATFSIGPGATVISSGSLTVQGTVSVSGSLAASAMTSHASSGLTVNAGGTVTTPGGLTMDGNITVNGKLNCGSLILYNDGAMTVNAGGTMTSAGAVTFDGGGFSTASGSTINIAGPINQNPSVTITAGNFYLSYATYIPPGSYTTLSLAGGGTYSFVANTTVTGNLSVASGTVAGFFTYYPTVVVPVGTLSLGGVGEAGGTWGYSGQTHNNTTFFANQNGYVIVSTSTAPQSTTTTLGALTTPVVYESSLSFTATVSPSPGGGTVQFTTNGVAMGSPVPVTSGSATLSTSALAAGSYGITAVYGGTTGYAGSVSGPSTQVVSKATPNVTVTVGTYAYTGMAQGPNGVTFSTPADTGPVTYSYTGTGNTTYGPSPTPPTAAGTYTVTATVAADANNNNATSISTAFVMAPAVLTVTASNVTKIYGTALSNPGAGATAFTATGLQNGETIGSATIVYGNGSAASAVVGTYSGSVTAGSAAGGTFSTANYSLNYVPGNIIVIKATPMVTVTVGGPYIYCGSGQGPIGVTYSTPSDTGTVTWSYAGTGATTYQAASAPPTGAGTYTATATVAADANNNGASSMATPFIIGAASTSLVLTSSLNPSGFRDGVVFNAMVYPAAATGTVEFETNGVNWGTGVTVTGGTAASPALTSLPRGTDAVVAVYSGDANYLLSTSTSLSQIVTNHPPQAAPCTVSRTAGTSLRVFWSDLTNSWSDTDGDAVTVASVNLVTTNGVAVRTNSALLLYTNTLNVNDQITYGISDGHGGTNLGLINIVVTPFVTGQQTASPLTVNGGSVTTSFYGVTNYTYEVQRSTNMYSGAGWVNIATNTVNASAQFSVTDRFSDLGGNLPSAAYYRLEWHP